MGNGGVGLCVGLRVWEARGVAGGGGCGGFEVANGFDVAWWALGKATGGKREARLGGVSGFLGLASRLVLLHHEGQILLHQAVWCIFCAGSFCVMTDGFGSVGVGKFTSIFYSWNVSP